MEVLKKQFIPYTLALRMKTLGFDEPCFGFYKLGSMEIYYDTILQGQNHKFRNNTQLNLYGDLKEKVSTPTYSQAIDFIQETFGLYVEFPIDKTTYPKYSYQYNKFTGNPKDLTEKEWGWGETIMSEFLYKDKYEAMKAYLEEILKTIKKNKL